MCEMRREIANSLGIRLGLDGLKSEAPKRIVWVRFPPPAPLMRPVIPSYDVRRLQEDPVDVWPSRRRAWVHAYLHRKEGDPWNAAYWYRRAHQPVASDSLETEWTRIVTSLLARST